LKKHSAIFAFCSLLTLVTLVAYWPVTRHQFVTFDDPQYLYHNPHVKAGLTPSALLWAFQSGYAGNWHPLTWISHMLDCHLYGLNPAGHHLTNLLFHLTNTLLLFLLLRRLTGSLWRSAFVAALFAWHPLHVESVAWASERKDVLSTCFFLLTIWAYARYAEGGRESAECRMQNAETRNLQPATLLTPPVSRYYVLSLFLFALGLMSKPMLVTLPFVLLLLDYWPLQRLRLPMLQSSRFEVSPPAPESSPLWPLVREKLPFFALALAASIVTYLVQRSGGAVSSLELLPIHSRITNALVAYFRYLSLTLWPAQLAVVYPYSRQLAAGSVIAAALLLAGASGFFLSRVRRQPYLVVGWLWFLGTLVPTIGLVQVGPQCMADRYTYIPSIGLFLLIVWGLDALLDPWPPKRRNSGSGILPLTGLDALLDPWPPKRLYLPVTGTLALAACLACSYRQLTCWQDSETLFRHAIAVTRDNYVAHTSLGKALLEQGKPDEAAVHLAKAIRLTPDDPEAHYNLGTVRIFQDRPDQAAACFSEALRLKPDYGAAHRNLGVILISQGKPDEGAAHLAAAVKFKPDDPETHFNFGFALLELTRPREAADQFSRAIRLNPDSPSSHYHLALALACQDKPQQALPHAQKAHDLALRRWSAQQAAGQKPDLFPFEPIALRLSGFEEKQGNLPRAIQLLELAAKASPYPDTLQKEIEELKQKHVAPPPSAAPKTP